MNEQALDYELFEFIEPFVPSLSGPVMLMQIRGAATPSALGRTGFCHILPTLSSEERPSLFL